MPDAGQAKTWLISTNALRRPLTVSIYRPAADFWSKRGIRRACVASINEIPFASNSFDAVVSVDVLECEAVDEDRGL